MQRRRRCRGKRSFCWRLPLATFMPAEQEQKEAKEEEEEEEERKQEEKEQMLGVWGLNVVVTTVANQRQFAFVGLVVTTDTDLIDRFSWVLIGRSF